MGATSIGPAGDTGGNENHGSDGRGNKTLGEQSSQVPPSTGKQGPRPTGAAQDAADNGRPSQQPKEKQQ